MARVAGLGVHEVRGHQPDGVEDERRERVAERDHEDVLDARGLRSTVLPDLEKYGERHFLTLSKGGGRREQLTAKTLTAKFCTFSVPAYLKCNCERERSP